MSTNRSLSRHYGAILNTQKVAELTVTENAYAPQSKLPKHSHEQACFCLVLQGTYTEIYQQKTLTCEPFSLVYRPAGEVHSDYFSNARVRCFIIEFEHRWLDRVHTYAAGLDGPKTFQQNSLVWLAVKLRKEIRRMDAVTPLTIEGLMLEMMAEASRHHGKSSRPGVPPWLKQVREILLEHSTERLTLSSLAEVVGVHPVYLACAFRRHYRCTIGEYVRQLRVELACRELSVADTPLTQVALTAGFADQSQFSRTFKRVVGLTPTEYRKTLRLP
jgi:AraC family transcriptional regulator